MIMFKIGNERKIRKNAIISGDPIVSAHRNPRGLDWILSTQRIKRGRAMGGDLDDNGCFP